MTISLIVPAFNAAAELPRLLEALAAQTHRDFEAILVDDASRDNTAELAAAAGWHVIRMPVNRGPAACRNAGANAATSEVLVFTDSDCRPEADWLERLTEGLRDDRASAVMGRVHIEASNRLGQAIAALGFPAGGSTGFEKIWPVDTDGFTTSLSTCNCAIRRTAFEAAGRFDTGFPYAGGEDSLLAYRLIDGGRRIRFCPQALVWHAARDRWGDFVRWQFRRGVSAYLFSTKVVRRRGFLSLRFWSTRNIIKTWAGHRLFPQILLLLAASVVVQAAGFFWGRCRRKAKVGS
jgi:cellulose synthase/poly-beta-1,6-N-acetylglucosamine synthase-like glycosyltransferase